MKLQPRCFQKTFGSQVKLVKLYNGSMGNKLYQVILADPPWRYDFSQSDCRKIENQYPTMSTEELCAMQLPIDQDAVLFLWATAPKLEDAFQIIKAWGFAYKSHAVWDKVKIGMGYWFRGQHELLMVATRGTFSPPKPSERISSVIRSERNLHSKKPDLVRDYIASWYPQCNKLEMFARRTSMEWDVFGNELKSDVEIYTPNLTPTKEEATGPDISQI